MDSTEELNKKLYLLDGSFISGITPYVDINDVITHPLWGSNLLFNTEEAVINGHKDYIRGSSLLVSLQTAYIFHHYVYVYIFICSRSRLPDHQHVPSKHQKLSKILGLELRTKF